MTGNLFHRLRLLVRVSAHLGQPHLLGDAIHLSQPHILRAVIHPRQSRELRVAIHPRQPHPLRVAVLATALAFGGTPQSAILGVDEAGALPGPSAASSTTSGSGSFTTPWSWPLAPEPSVLRHFQPPPERWKAGHRGVDLSAAQPPGAGTAAPVHSPADGVVSFTGTVVNRPVLSIDHGDGLVTSFEPVATTLRKGDRVAAGDAVGTIGGPPHCPVLCVHWGVRLHGEYVDPLAYVSDRRPSVLLPLRR